jgi:hypothetical protein
MKFMKVASKVASQKTTASGTPDKSATLRSIADCSFRWSQKQVRYKKLLQVWFAGATDLVQHCNMKHSGIAASSLKRFLCLICNYQNFKKHYSVA